MQNPEKRAAGSRRLFIKAALGTGATFTASALGLRPAWAADAATDQSPAPAIVASAKGRPLMPSGVMTGDITDQRAIIWSRSDRPARMVVDYSLHENFRNGRRIVGPAASAENDFATRIDLAGLHPGHEIHYRVWYESLEHRRATSEPLRGSFKTPPSHRRDVRFAFSGDEAGQGWGINPDQGGYRVYETMRTFHPDFFIHSGDQIYADEVLAPEVTLDDGTVWRNLVTPAKSKVAETLDEFRGNFAYNLLDENKRAFAAEVPFLVQWDDHEVRNNWYPGETIGIPAYTEKCASVLAQRARQAMLEYNPFRINQSDPNQIYRPFRHGPSTSHVGCVAFHRCLNPLQQPLASAC